jgi:hypothetical protein
MIIAHSYFLPHHLTVMQFFLSCYLPLFFHLFFCALFCSTLIYSILFCSTSQGEILAAVLQHRVTSRRV